MSSTAKAASATSFTAGSGEDVCVDVRAVKFAGCEYQGENPPEEPEPEFEPEPEVEELSAPCSATARTTSYDIETANLMIALSDKAYDINGRSTLNRTLAPEPSRSDTDAYRAPRDLDDVSCWTLRATIDQPWTGTQAYVAENRWTGDVVVAFRGSTSLTDWLVDAQAAKVPFRLPDEDRTVIWQGVHSGFAFQYGAAKKDLEGIIETLSNLKLIRPDARLFFTGHSLGGALATLASLDLADDAEDAGYSSSERVLYTFGAPKAITKDLDNHHGRYVPNAHATINAEDNVPRLLGGDGGNAYTHIPRAVVLNQSGTRLRIDYGAGVNFSGCATGTFTSGHSRDIYADRLDMARDGSAPVSAELVEDGGNFRMRWSGVEGSCDTVGIYYRTSRPNRNTAAQSTRNAVADDNNTHRTLVNVGSDFWVGWKNAFGDFIYLDRYDRTTPQVWLEEEGFTDRLEMNWRMTDPGDRDWVYLFQGTHPSNGIRYAHEVFGVDVRKRASSSGKDLLQTVGSGRRGTVWYIAYFERDGFGPDRLLGYSRFVTP